MIAQVLGVFTPIFRKECILTMGWLDGVDRISFLLRFLTKIKIVNSRAVYKNKARSLF